MTALDYLKRLRDPILLRVDIASPIWQASVLEARFWLAGCVLLDLSAQWLAGQLGWATLALSLLTPLLFVWFHPRLVMAVASLYIAQSLGNILAVLSLESAGVPGLWIQGVTAGWQIWCMVGLVVLIKQHLRTPKRQRA